MNQSWTFSYQSFFSIFVHVLDFVGLAGHAMLILHVLFANELCLQGAYQAPTEGASQSPSIPQPCCMEDVAVVKLSDKGMTHL